MNNNRRRNFGQVTKSNFRRRNGSINSNNSNNYIINGNKSFNRNKDEQYPYVGKAMNKFQQLAKDAQSVGDLVLVENYLQHADHYLRRLNELNERNTKDQSIQSGDIKEKNKEEQKKETQQIIS